MGHKNLQDFCIKLYFSSGINGDGKGVTLTEAQSKVTQNAIQNGGIFDIDFSAAGVPLEVTVGVMDEAAVVVSEDLFANFIHRHSNGRSIYPSDIHFSQEVLDLWFGGMLFKKGSSWNDQVR